MRSGKVKCLCRAATLLCMGSQRRFGVWAVCSAFLIGSCAGTGPISRADEPTAVLVGFDNAGDVAGWTTVNDPVMGGRSTSTVAFGNGGLVFSGSISLENNGGFASARSPQDPDIGRKAAGAKALRVRAVGDGKTYLLKVGSAGQPWSYVQRFATESAVERVYDLPVAGFRPVGMRLDPAPEAPPNLDPAGISQISFYILDKQQGPFELAVRAVDAAA